MDDRQLKISPAQVAYRTVLLAAGLLLVGLLFRQLVTLLLAMLAGVGTLALIISLLTPPFVDQTHQFVDDVPSIVKDLEKVYADVTGQNAGEVGDKVQHFVERYTDHPDR